MQGYFESKEFKQLLQSYEEAEQRGEHIFLDSEQLTDIAEYYHWMGDSDKAVEVADYALSIYEGAAGPLVLKARIALLKDNSPEEARQLAEQIDDKLDLDYFYINAEILIAVNRPEEADDYLEECEEQVSDADYPDYLLDVATLFVDYELPALARKWLEKSEEETFADYRETLGRICYFEKDYTQCEQIFERLIDDSPYNAYYWEMLACCQLAMWHLDDAITSSEYATAINPYSESALLYKGQALMRLKSYEPALECFEQYSKIRPCNVDGYLNAGLCFLAQERSAEGLAQLRKAEVKALRHCKERLWEIYQEEAFAYSQVADVDRALRYLNQMDHLSDNDANETMVVRGHVYLENGAQAKAHECFRAAIENSGFSPSIMMRVAVSLYDNDHIQAAYNLLSALRPEDFETMPQTHAYLAICAHDLDKPDEYLCHLKAATEQVPSVARMVLGPLLPEGMEPSEFYDYALKNQEQP